MFQESEFDKDRIINPVVVSVKWTSHHKRNKEIIRKLCQDTM